MRVAIVGTGIAGMTAAYHLSREHDLTVFEAGPYVGGHTNTVDIETPDGRYALDTGFIVCNDRNYPNFLELLGSLGVDTQPSRMSFSVKCERTGLEYNGGSLRGLFAQPRNLVSPSFHRMIRDVMRFNREAPSLIAENAEGPTLNDFLEQGRYSSEFVDNYLIPMGAAIWSSKPVQMRQFPARYFVLFFQNHGLLQLRNRPNWKTVVGGSRRYVEQITAPYRDRIRVNSPIVSIRRDESGVMIQPASSPAERFDRVVIAAHSDQALRMISDATQVERDVLSSFEYQANETILHTDSSLLPTRKRAWASWNYHIPRDPVEDVTVTYNLNSLQQIESPTTFCVTLNRTSAIRPETILRRFVYHHPVYTREAVSAQKRWKEINGVNRTYFCGAYWGYGFHEDGVNSALAVARHLGSRR